MITADIRCNYEGGKPSSTNGDYDELRKNYILVGNHPKGQNH